MRKTIDKIGWFVALDLCGCPGDASEITTSLDSLSFTDTGGNGEDTGNDDESSGGSATQASADGSSDGGPADDGGPTDGGPTDGGPTDGGPTDGGPTDDGAQESSSGAVEESSSGAASDAGESSSSDGGGGPTSDGGDGGGGGACCEPQMGPGCGDTAVQDCVCAFDDFCCTDTWDDLCVQEANDSCDAMCDGGGTSGGTDDGGGGGGACCEPQMGPGCDDMAVQDCVCAFDDFCCTDSWDDLCVQEANDSCDAMCDGGGGGGGECCAPQDGPGCGGGAIEDCVCAFDDFCCTDTWDDLCVQEANDSCDAMCDGGGGGGGASCCDAQDTPGCDDMTVQDCVCSFDDFCCTDSWDDLCVQEAVEDCGAAC
ncbi:MAG TPA: hypothetical protein VG755_38840 [Nannocystaceae bacterium]|nr:hypothetical protein [Nannocystaceae bacterium]